MKRSALFLLRVPKARFIGRSPASFFMHRRCASFPKRKQVFRLALFFLEVTVGFEPTDNGVADRGLTTWLRHQILLIFYAKYRALLKNNILIIEDVVTGADYGARTRHLNLGKVALYQMS